MSRRLTPARPSTSTTRDNAPTIPKDANSIPQNREKDSKPDDPNDGAADKVETTAAKP